MNSAIKLFNPPSERPTFTPAIRFALSAEARREIAKNERLGAILR